VGASCAEDPLEQKSDPDYQERKWQESRERRLARERELAALQGKPKKTEPTRKAGTSAAKDGKTDSVYSESELNQRHEGEVARDEAQRKLDAGELEQADTLAISCGTSDGQAGFDAKPCFKISEQARSGMAASSLAAAKKQMAANKIQDASVSVGRCLQFDPGNSACMAIQRRLQPKLDKLTAKLLKETNAKEAAKKRPIISIENVRGRMDDDGNPWVRFEATASRAFRTGWIVVKAKCKTGTKTKADESEAIFSEVDAGDTKELEEPFSKITLPEGAEWCQFEFRYKENIFFSAGVPLRVLCWQGREVVPDTKCPAKAVD
jgi:hypothetical protein